mgnify:CR=1 FL=1
MTREQAQIVRLLLMCVAWAIGQTLTRGLAVDLVDMVVPAALAIGVYVLTDDLGRARYGGGNAKYWRGRRIEDDERRGGRWN